jgi:hypothetical protein
MRITFIGLTEVGVGIGIAPLELVTCSHVFSPQLPLNQTCKLSSPNCGRFSRKAITINFVRSDDVRVIGDIELYYLT